MKLAGQLEGNQADAYFGCSIAGAGDVNGDGYADVIVGACGYDKGQTDEGAAFLFLGSAFGLVGMDPGTAAAVLESNQANAGLGFSVAGAGDVNGDGYGDVLVGAWTYDNGQTNEGAAFLFLGSPSGLIGTDPATAAGMIESNQADAFLGYSVAGAGDVNGDGYADVIVGANKYYNAETNEGGAFLFLGSPSGLIGRDPATAAAVLESNQASAYLGGSVAGAGDVNGDGYADVIVGAYRYDNGQTDEGAAFLFLGSPSGLVGRDPATAAAVLESNQESAYFGWSVAGAGDVNGDGYADVIIGALAYDNGQTDEGAAFLFLGSPSGLIGRDPATAAAVLESNQASSGFASSVAGAGDMNGDGYADVVVGAVAYSNGQTDEGAAFLFLGSPSGLIGTNLATAAAVIEGNQDYAGLGDSVAGAGDVNGDGYADVIVGADNYSNGQTAEGAAFLFLGSPSGLVGTDPATAAAVIESNQAGADLGYNVAGAGDVNGDGYADVLVGAVYYDNGQTDEGAAFLFLGSPSGLIGRDPATAAAVLESNQESAYFGWSVAGAGDVNGDGYADVVVGVIYHDNGQTDEGAAFLFLGSPSGLMGTNPGTAAAVLESNQADAYFGYSVAGAGDVNGDGYADVIVGADHYDNGQTNEGAAFLFLGSPSGLVGTDPGTAAAALESNQGGAYFGSSAAGAGDVNGDGYADVIVGAPYYDNGQHYEGAAFLFLGSPSGLKGRDPTTAAAVLESNQANAELGYSVAGAGDVNGDGHADVIVGAVYYDNGETDEGAAFLFLGSPSGLIGRDPGTAAAVLESNQARPLGSSAPYFGESVAGAGDVNEDGYADVLVGADWYTNGQLWEGAAFLFLGSPSGLIGTDPGTAAVALESNQAWADFGSSVSGAGDVNGDGYADVLVGAPGYDNGQEDEGAAFLFLGGNSHAVLSRAPELRKNGNTLVCVPGINAGTSSFRVQMEATNPPTGAMAAKLEWEVKPYGSPLDGIGTGISSGWINVSTANYVFNEGFTVPGEANGFHWRARILYMPLNLFQPNAGQTPLTPKVGLTLPPKPQHGPWFSPQWATVGPSDFRTTGYRPPTNPGVTVTKTPLMTTDDIQCIVSQPSTSPAVPQKPIQYEYVWTTGTGRTVAHTSSLTNDTLSASEIRKHEVWTCSVRAWDGVSYSHLPQSDTASEILNTPPGSPGVSVSSSWNGRQSANANLVCQVTTPSPDPDVDEQMESVVYRYQWYKNGSPAQMQEFSGALTSQVNLTELTAGDRWYCIVTPKDTETTGVAAQTAEVVVVDGGVLPASVAVGVDPGTVTLGESLTLSAQLFVPAPYNTPTASTVSFGLVPPTGPAESAGAQTLTGYRYTCSYLPDLASQWHVAATWEGDTTYSASTSTPETFTVRKAQPEMALGLSHNSVLLGLSNAPGFKVTATLDVPGFPPQLSGLLSGLPIHLSVVRDNTPKGEATANTNASGAAIFDKTVFDTAIPPILFDEEGVWKFKAEFREGDLASTPEKDNFRSVSSPDFNETDAKLVVKRGAGYAIIVHGRLDAAGEGVPEHAATTDFIYTTLRKRAFNDTDIRYFRQLDAGPLPAGVEVARDGADQPLPPSRLNLQTAIETWAKQKLDESPAPLYLILVDHGSKDWFHLDEPGTGPQEYVTSGDLNLWLNTIETGATPPNVFVIYGACHSGSFIQNLSKPNRTIIASCRSDEISYRGVDSTPDDPNAVRDGEFFLMEFFRTAGEGTKLKEAFEQASTLTAAYTATKSNGEGAETPQHPLLDDNGDERGTSGDLPCAPGTDGVRVREEVLGLGSNAAGGISWFNAKLSFAYGSPDTPFLWAETTTGRALDPADRAWLEIKTPGYDGGKSADPTNPNNPDYERVADMVGPILPSSAPVDLGSGKYRFEWSEPTVGAQVGFATAGTYKVYYFLKDGQTGQVSAYLVTSIYVPLAGNAPPTKVSLIYPENSTIEFTTTYFAWTASTDPNNDPITYRIELDTDPNFGSPDHVVKEGITETLTQVPGLQDGKTYHWKVIPVDAYGASPAANDVWTFTTQNGNPDVPGAIIGAVVEQATGAPLSGAMVEVTPGTKKTAAGLDGAFYLFNMDSGSYFVQAGATGYPSDARHVTVVNGSTAQLPPFQLALSTAPALSVTPGTWTSISIEGATQTFTVSNIGTGSFTWKAEVLTGSGWMRLTDVGFGTDAGAFTVQVDRNDAEEWRAGALKVTATAIGGGTVANSPLLIPVTEDGVNPAPIEIPVEVPVYITLPPDDGTDNGGGTDGMSCTPAKLFEEVQDLQNETREDGTRVVEPGTPSAHPAAMIPLPNLDDALTILGVIGAVLWFGRRRKERTEKPR